MTIREAMYGRDNTKRRGWFEASYFEYSLHRYMNVRSEDTADLFRRGTFQRLLLIVSESFRGTSLLNSLISMNLFSGEEGVPGVVERVAEFLVEHVESGKTLGTRVDQREKELRRDGRYFAGVSRPLRVPGAPSLNDGVSRDDPGLNGALIALEGTLCRVDAIRTFDGVRADSLPDNVPWVVTDLPPFSMVPGTEEYSDDLVALRIPEDIQQELMASVPFASRLDWYPYVQVFGKFSNSFDAKNPTLKTIDFSWLQIRNPISRGDTANRLRLFQEPEFGPPIVDLNDATDALLFLYAIQICLVMHNMAYDPGGGPFKQLVEAAVPTAEMPTLMTEFFGV